MLAPTGIACLIIVGRDDLAFQKSLEDDPPVEWTGQFDQAWFRGSIALDEIVFFHRPSGTVIVAHGEWQCSGGQAYLARALPWMS